jgi:hypothetical protein
LRNSTVNREPSPPDYQVRIYAANPERPRPNANVDVEVTDADGTRWTATFFTLGNLEALFQKNAVTGECRNGLYLWASDMILVREISSEVIEATVADLKASGEFSDAFRLLDRRNPA